MSQDEQDILAEAAKILDGASERFLSERAEGVGREFLKLENAMWQQMGKPNGEHSLFSVCLIEDKDMDSVLQEVKDNPNRLIKGEGTIDGQKPDSMLGLSLVAEGGDIYEMLEHKMLSLHLATDDSVIGVLARMDATGRSPQEDKSAKHDVCVTMMLIAEAIYIAVRMYNEPDAEVMFSTIHSDDYEGGQDKLVDAMLVFFALPKAMYSEKPAVMKALYQDLLAQQAKKDKQ
jgi:hypothetical protein